MYHQINRIIIVRLPVLTVWMAKFTLARVNVPNLIVIHHFYHFFDLVWPFLWHIFSVPKRADKSKLCMLMIVIICNFLRLLTSFSRHSLLLQSPVLAYFEGIHCLFSLPFVYRHFFECCIGHTNDSEVSIITLIWFAVSTENELAVYTDKNQRIQQKEIAYPVINARVYVLLKPLLSHFIPLLT